MMIDRKQVFLKIDLINRQSSVWLLVWRGITANLLIWREDVVTHQWSVSRGDESESGQQVVSPRLQDRSQPAISEDDWRWLNTRMISAKQEQPITHLSVEQQQKLWLQSFL